MQTVLRLVLAIAEGRAVEALGRLIGRAALMVGAAVLAACCAVGAVGCGLAALWIFAAHRVGPVGAPLIVAGLLAAIGIGVVMSMRSRRTPPPMDIDHAAVVAELVALVREHKVSTVLAALVAGLTAGGRRS